MYCRKCGARNEPGDTNCVQCGDTLLVVPPSVQVQPTEEAITYVIPYKNPYGLISYYLAVFSLIPCVGMVLAIPAVGLGIYGLYYAGKYPERRGKIHAWAGVVVGGLCFLGNVIAIVFVRDLLAHWN